MDAIRAPATETDAPPAPRRLPLLDVLRGVAILGTLGTNIWIFTHPGGELGFFADASAVSPLPDPGAPVTAAALVEAAVRFAANGKFLALLTVLFGVGVAIQYRSAAKRGLPWPGPYKWRALLLFAEGTVHFVFVFAFDVLMGYAVVALVVAWLLGRSDRAQRVVMYTAGAAHVALMALLSAGAVATGAISGSPEPDPSVNALFASADYPGQIMSRLDNVVGLRTEPVLCFLLLLFLFLLGTRLLRAGAFEPGERGRALRARMALIGIGAGLPLNIATTLAGPDMMVLDRWAAAPVLAVGYIGVVGLVLDRVRTPGPASRALASLGRCALSGYVLQNVLGAVLCYGIGFGLATTFAGSGPWWVLALLAGMCAALLAGATLWLRFFEQGPLEAGQKWLLARVPRRGSRA
ncbi:uncharacterized protein CLV63_110154 [Murinocardiopsis flavida]|uniref:DUF418 domain-containing protein n=1 Tax=Murinocardiopsis flavida TaxID=645275 RepID=A0A2P8DI08_9ACTN|nr:DUF418 domain-containing protein [Murinocardiopsis flavida]PSK96855.1 uncharacterized protein CLV63_110154 [Murinocardiopsis flavida]